jgi:curved DNA-binding protein CbpA
MKTPFAVLDIPEDSDDEKVRKAYLAKVRSFPPERFPEEFKQIRRAYEQIATEKDRLSFRLFYRKLPEPADIAALILDRRTSGKRPTVEELQKNLAADLRSFCSQLKLQ